LPIDSAIRHRVYLLPVSKQIGIPNMQRFPQSGLPGNGLAVRSRALAELLFDLYMKNRLF
jgi:hypothetical protein